MPHESGNDSAAGIVFPGALCGAPRYPGGLVGRKMPTVIERPWLIYCLSWDLSFSSLVRVS
jgi:hypothetical protein